MKAIILKNAGNVEQLQYTEVDNPNINEDEVLVKVKSISINPVDVKARASEDILNWIYNKDRPVILGWDISGEILETGKKVVEFKPGDEIFGMINFFGNGKAYAEYVASPINHITLKPNSITHQEAAASAMVGSTAYQALVEVAKIKKGNKVLIHGASGGVGHMAVQIAKHFGCYVIGTSSAKNKDFVLSIGADEHVDYTDYKALNNIKNIDIILDTVQGETLLNSVEYTNKGGTIVTLPTPEIPIEVQEKAKIKNITITFMMVSSKKDTIEAVANLLHIGALKPFIHQVYSFENMANAHLELESKRVVGKVIVDL